MMYHDESLISRSPTINAYPDCKTSLNYGHDFLLSAFVLTKHECRGMMLRLLKMWYLRFVHLRHASLNILVEIRISCQSRYFNGIRTEIG